MGTNTNCVIKEVTPMNIRRAMLDHARIVFIKDQKSDKFLINKIGLEHFETRRRMPLKNSQKREMVFWQSRLRTIKNEKIAIV
ncbi:hypothetical protein [Paenibacillus mucilaginosus]|uniref:hypothetical protein n=1 Tax=Paenibacillus mucilaginosus TaxID=61624 RepID=UPI003D1F0FA9